MPINKQALQTNFNPFVRRAQQGLQTALSKNTNLQRQGGVVGQGSREAMHGYGDVLSQGFGQALRSTEQQRQFDEGLAFNKEQFDTSLTEQQRQFDENLAFNKDQAATSAALRKEQLDSQESGSKVAGALGIAGLGLQAYDTFFGEEAGTAGKAIKTGIDAFKSKAVESGIETLGVGSSTALGASNATGVGGAVSLQTGAPATVSADAAYAASQSATPAAGGSAAVGLGVAAAFFAPMIYRSLNPHAPVDDPTAMLANIEQHGFEAMKDRRGYQGLGTPEGMRQVRTDILDLYGGARTAPGQPANDLTPEEKKFANGDMTLAQYRAYHASPAAKKLKQDRIKQYSRYAFGGAPLEQGQGAG